MGTRIDRPKNGSLKKVRTREYLACRMKNGQWKEREKNPHPNALATVRVKHVWMTYRQPLEGDDSQDRIIVEVSGDRPEVSNFLKTVPGWRLVKVVPSSEGITAKLSATF